MAITLVHSEANHGDQTRTIPLSTWAGTGRKALVIASWQGAAHGSTGMGATPAVFTELLRQPRPGTFQPAVLVWWADIPSGTSNETLPIDHGGCGYALWVLEGAASFAIVDAGGSGGNADTYAVSGSGLDMVIAGVSTNSLKSVSQAGGLTLSAPPPYYSETVGGHALPGVSGSFTWSGADDYAAVTVEVAESTVTLEWGQDTDTVVTGSIVGSGVGVDVDTGDNLAGFTTTVGSAGEIIDGRTVDPAGPTSISNVRARIHLPGDYPTGGEGYAVTYQIEDAAAAVVKAEATFPPETGSDAGLIPGETKRFATGPLSGLSWPDGGAAPRFRVKLTPTPITTLRPTGGGGVPGRLGRPRMVELWRSQGETTGGPTLTVPDRWVDPVNGSDGNNGLTEGQAWQTMSHALAQTQGLGVGVGYKSGTITQAIDLSGVGSGTNYANRVNTHYVLQGHSVTFLNDWRSVYPLKLSHVSYLQISGFRFENTTHTQGGNTANAIYGLNIQDYEGNNDCHHIVMADCTGVDFSGSGIATYGARYVRMLGCEIYDSGWWTNYGGSGFTANNADRPTDATPAGYIDSDPIDIWVENCYITGSRQKVDSSFITNGTNKLFDGNAFAVDFYHDNFGANPSWYPIRTAFINCIAHNSGGASYNAFDAGNENYVINCLGAYGGRHLAYRDDPSDPVFGMDPQTQIEFKVQNYSSPGSTGIYWNSVGVGGAWMSGSAAFGGFGATLIGSNNYRWGPYGSDSYSSQLPSAPNFVNGSNSDGYSFDPRPQAGSGLLSGGDLSLLAKCTDDQGNQITTDFAGNPIAASGSGHVGPYSQAV